jgi:hypothetical protein
MSHFLKELTREQDKVAAAHNVLSQFAKRHRHFTAIENRIRKICPHHVTYDLALSGGTSYKSLAIYISDTKTKSPRDLAHIFYKLERLNGNLQSIISEGGSSISYSNSSCKRIDKKVLYITISYCWHRPSDSTCQIIVTGHRETESYQMVRCKEPIFQVVCP